MIHGIEVLLHEECKLQNVRRQATRRFLHGSFTVCLDTDPDQAEEDAPQRGAYCDADIHVKLGAFEADALLGMGNQIAEQVSPDSIFNLCVKEFARKNYLTGHC